MNKIEKKRRAKGLSPKELAGKAGITPESVRHYERGLREPKASILKKLAQALDCKMEDLI